MKNNKLRYIIIALAILMGIRAALPFVVKWYVNKSLASLDEYMGHVEEIDLFILAGSYTIKDLSIKKIENDTEMPFIRIPETNLSIQWKALFNGELVSEIVCRNPEINFAFSDSQEETQTGVEEDWTVLLKDLMPIKLNRFQIIEGKINLVNIISTPATDVTFANFNAELTNISNVEDKDVLLPTPVVATANVEGLGGNFDFKAHMNLLKTIPDFEYDMRLIDMQAVKLNPMAEHFANLNFEKGQVSLISEMAVQNGKLKGYLKPIGNDIQIFQFNEEKKRTLSRFFTELFADTGKVILNNKKKDQVASRIPLEGTLENTSSDFWPILFSSLKNAYIEAFQKTVEEKEFFREL